MRKIKYKFNPETLSFEKIEVVLSEYIVKKILPNFLSAIILGVFLTILASHYIDSPYERNLITENSQLLYKYEFLNKQLNKVEGDLTDIQNRDDKMYRLIFEANPVPAELRKAGFGGSDRYSNLKGLQNTPILIETTKKLDNLTKQMVVQSKSFDEVIDLVENKEKMLASIPAIQPIANKQLTRFGSPFGYRLHPILKYVRMHEGIDLTAPKGTPVYASGDGIVIRADAGSHGYGNHIKLNHGYGYVSVYGHLEKILIRPGQKVKRGDLIGTVGNSGLSTSPHLHYEVRINGKPVNPVNFYSNDISDEQYQQLVDDAETSNTHIFE